MNSIRIFLFIVCLLSVHAVRIEDNGYKGITISFSEKVQLENSNFNFEKLKYVLSNASEILFNATRKRSYFEEFVFIIPSKWTNDSVCDGDVSEAPHNIDIYVTDSEKIPSLMTQHSKGCGQEGDIIYMPIDWLTGEVEDLAHQFVQRWSTYRYGVFSEDPERPGSCIATSDYSWSPTGCYSVDWETEASFDENGLPVCYFPDDFQADDLRLSIMFSSNLSKPFYFCDGSDSFPHNAVAPTLHNRLCDGKSVWSVVKNSEDFRYARNLPVTDAKPPTFRCFKESKIHMTLAVQDTDTKLRTEIRYAFLYFLSNLAVGDLDVSLATFSNDSLTDAAEPLTNLDLEDGAKLKSHLLSGLTLNKEIPNVCLICGLQKAYKVSAANPNRLRVVVLFANVTSLQDADISELAEVIRGSGGGAVLHLILLGDEEGGAVPSSLVDAVQEGGGRISRIGSERVSVFARMNVALLDASRNVLLREDKILVVHQKTRADVVSGFQDVFVTPKNVKGSLYYSMQCKERGEIDSDDSGCSVLDQQLQSPICESKVDLRDENTAKTWKYSFEYIAGKEGTTCVSLALLKLDSSAENLFTVNGWLNHDKITPGYNALIIYAEVISRKDESVRVEALISGPGLTDFRLELRDNGNGDPDVIKGDHIYSRYFTSFSQKGTYTVSIKATSSAAKGNSEKTDNTVAQTKVIGSFRVTTAPPKEDILPPNRVSDLNVVSIDNVNKTALLQWTAPGDNYDDGRATEYKMYFTDDWRNLQEALMDKILPNILDTSEMTPKLSGDEEKEILNLPNSSLPMTYYIALQALDKSGNEGRLSNIIQMPLIVIDPINENLTENNTNDDKSTVTSILEEKAISNKYLYAIAGSALCFIILIIMINILIWILCFRKYKRNCTATVLNEVCHLNTQMQLKGDNINSDENILKSEYENSHIQERQNEHLPHDPNTVHDNNATSNPLLYAKVNKRSKNPESLRFSPQNTEISKKQHIQLSTHRENDLGFV